MRTIGQRTDLGFLFRLAENDVPARTTTSTKGRAPSPPTSRYGSTRLDNPYASQSFDTVNSNTTSVLPASTIQDTVRSTVSTGSFDYLRGPRRCIIRVDRKKGLGFVLSATGDYDHTITDVEKVCRCTCSIINKLSIIYFLNRIQLQISLAYRSMMKF